MRTYLADLDGTLHDIRACKDLPAVYHPSDYTAGRALGRELRAAASYGIVYDSVRDPGGECAGVFRPPVLSHCIQGPHFGYLWDGERITTVVRKTIERSF